jgi:hypothetical protein
MERIEPNDATHADDDATDADETQVQPSDTPASDEPPAGFDRWRRGSALGAVGTGVARGLHAVFAPPVDETVIVASVPGEPPGEDERIRVILDPDDPTKSVAIVPERKDGSAHPPS